MFKPPSYQHDYTLCSAQDPALDLPDLPTLSEEPTDEERAAVKAILDENLRRYRVAYETGSWSDIVKPGQKPTIFTFRQVHGTQLTWFRNQCARLELNDEAQNELLFRLAWRKVENLGGFELELDRDNPELVSIKTMDLLYSLGRTSNEPGLGRSLMGELALWIRARTIRGVSPLS